ncbi:MAG TPA: response regulator transcription factor [Kouleothrix sp.]|uniref:response regulator n=1 Tax=Kouleothrix sp. TaxID=2779161 RepID=UPI002BF580B7|nr:response regulator transcription factor [Kouleothrix sp.]HRC75171.1 response regulator transcription factor [Kouleothrix sp.]
MGAEHILVIDDELSIRRLLRSSLGERGYRVTAVATGEEGLEVAGSDPPAAVILDLGLPNQDGFAICGKLRAESEVPILILSARYDEMEKVRALDLGADDYITKPFGTHELLARIRVALRRANRPAARPSLIVADDLRIDLERRQVANANGDVRLTPTEYSLLTTLAAHPGRVLTHQWLLAQVWGPGYEQDVQNLHVFISQLRRKIEAQPAKPRYILTEPGIGYRFCALDDPAS